VTCRPVPPSPRPGRIRALHLTCLLGVFAAPALGPAPLGAADRVVSANEVAAQRALDAADPAQAVRLLKKPATAGEFLARSTAHLLLGEEADGRRDLDRALELDPALRQGWLNRAGLAIADGKFDAAYADLLRARELDPAAIDNDLNLGAVELLRGRLEPAMERFRAHVARAPSGEAHYLVATNLARAGYAALAAESLAQAMASDERFRARARADANFAAVAASPAFRDLLSRPLPPRSGAAVTQQVFAEPYDIDSARLINAAIDGLRDAGEPVETLVEVTEGWSLIWAGGLTAKIEPDTASKGSRVTLSGVSANPTDWNARTERLFRAIAVRLATRR
jgi:tetratricopeptide (TPR) repeat protein